MEYFNYITYLSPQEVPDYQYLMMLLDRGVTGQPPVRPPARRRLSDWPTSDEWDVRRDYAKVGANPHRSQRPVCSAGFGDSQCPLQRCQPCIRRMHGMQSTVCSCQLSVHANFA
jgi:hypothetical protein